MPVYQYILRQLFCDIKKMCDHFMTKQWRRKYICIECKKKKRKKKKMKLSKCSINSSGFFFQMPRDDEEICVICHDPLSYEETKSLDCKHVFHSNVSIYDNL